MEEGKPALLRHKLSWRVRIFPTDLLFMHIVTSKKGSRLAPLCVFSSQTSR